MDRYWEVLHNTNKWNIVLSFFFSNFLTWKQIWKIVHFVENLYTLLLQNFQSPNGQFNNNRYYVFTKIFCFYIVFLLLVSWIYITLIVMKLLEQYLFYTCVILLILSLKFLGTNSSIHKRFVMSYKFCYEFELYSFTADLKFHVYI